MKSSQSIKINKLVFAAMMIALGIILPFLTGQVPQIGSMLLPMHIPALIGGIILGPFYGLVIGLVSPGLRFLLFGMPPIYPVGLAMTFELAAYGFFAGLVFQTFKNKNLIIRTIIALVVSMILGRIVWGIVQYVIGIYGNGFTLNQFFAAAFITAWPGILLQFIIIPPIVRALSNVGALGLHRGQS